MIETVVARSALGRLGLGLVLAVVATAAGPVRAAGEVGPEGGWIAMLEACTGYGETGKIAVFDDWAPLRPDAAGCTAVAGCDRAQLDLGLRRHSPEVAAISLAVGDADLVGTTPGAFDPGQDLAIGDRPKHFACSNARPFATAFDEVRGATVDWLERAQAEGRLRPLAPGLEPGAGAFQGCGYDGRPFSLAVVAIPGMHPMMSVFYPAPPETGGLDASFCETVG